MRIDSTKLSGKCECGDTHSMTTQCAIVESGAMNYFDDYLLEFNMRGKRAIIYDENTYYAKNLIRPACEKEIILNPQNLHANEHATAEVLNQLKGCNIDYLVAVGGGTIHDTTRYCAHKIGIPFIACPTCASVDGFCSTVSAMTWKGCKNTMPGVAPYLVIADTSVIKEAPMRLALSGIGDILGKYTALADWKITHLVNGEHFCQKISDLTMDAVSAVFQCCDKVACRDEDATGQLIYALLLSGLAMQLMGNSRPASGSEHHISHMIEMEPPILGVHSEGLHGEKVGVGEILISEYYHKLGSIDDIENHVKPYRFFTESELRECWGDKLYEGIASENNADAMDGVTPEMLIKVWPQIQEVIATIPTPNELIDIYTRLGMKKTLEDIDVPSSMKEELIYFSPSVRKRVTFNKISRMIKGAQNFGEYSNDKKTSLP